MLYRRTMILRRKYADDYPIVTNSRFLARRYMFNKPVPKNSLHVWNENDDCARFRITAALFGVPRPEDLGTLPGAFADATMAHPAEGLAPLSGTGSCNMKLRVLDLLACPICGGNFELRDSSAITPVPSSEVSRPSACAICQAPASQRDGRVPGQPCASCYAQEIVAGVLVCSRGHVFGVSDGVPRLRLDQRLDKVPVPDKSSALSVAASFGAEWSQFDYEKDRTWHQGVQERCELFLKEVAMTPAELVGKFVLDAGCGNGSLSRGLNQFGCEVLAIDVSPSVAVAYKYYAMKGNDRTHFVQGDLMNPPLRHEVFDVIFSSGVLHHNPDTRLALRAIAKSLRPAGRIYIWVYGHVPGVVHRLKEIFRRTISPLPAGVKQAIVGIWLPQAMVRQYIRTALGRNTIQDRLKWSERFVLLLDHYTPRWRWEHTPEEVERWYRELGYDHIEKTEARAWGFGVAACKPPPKQPSSVAGSSSPYQRTAQ
jgi:2-polyprenyl-3-methyl-5-hydroxy-6-metoxy-1,4-benzoquinol methylase/uncharacterized protein YbaR (Trm112 family)